MTVRELVIALMAEDLESDVTDLDLCDVRIDVYKFYVCEAPKTGYEDTTKEELESILEDELGVSLPEYEKRENAKFQREKVALSSGEVIL